MYKLYKIVFILPPYSPLLPSYYPLFTTPLLYRHYTFISSLKNGWLLPALSNMEEPHRYSAYTICNLNDPLINPYPPSFL
jgi:hypothetical protein